MLGHSCKMNNMTQIIIHYNKDKHVGGANRAWTESSATKERY